MNSVEIRAVALEAASRIFAAAVADGASVSDVEVRKLAWSFARYLQTGEAK